MEGASFLLLEVVAVFSLDGFAPTGRGGEGSALWRWLGAVVGGSGCCGDGWELGGAGMRELKPCSFIEFRCRRLRRTDSAALYNAWRLLLPGGEWYGVAGIS